MSIETEVRTRLTSDGTVSGLVSTRIYPKRLPQNPTYPALTFGRVSGVRLHNLAGVAGRGTPRIQIDSWAKTYLGAQALAAAVRASLDGFNGTLTTIKATIRIDNEIDFDEPGIDQAGVQQVVVVLGHDADRLKPIVDAVEGASWTLNHDYLQGKTTSLKTGVAALAGQQLSDVLLLNVDQPRSADTVRTLLERHQASSFRITIPTHGGKGGHPILIAADLLPELAEIEEESKGLKAVVRRHAEATERFGVDDPTVLLDLNTPEQYQKALESGL